ncbi:hypothetical protein AGMMS49975_09840 [Clostridia bacterium]|nr:hypothetical protein AGMMS49975_09840 [Clostridia bacterium]
MGQCKDFCIEKSILRKGNNAIRLANNPTVISNKCARVSDTITTNPNTARRIISTVPRNANGTYNNDTKNLINAEVCLMFPSLCAIAAIPNHFLSISDLREATNILID